MAHNWDTGFMVRTPSWHRLEKAVLTESPRDWDTARKQAGLDWDVVTGPVYTEKVLGELEVDASPVGYQQFEQIPGYQRLSRDDDGKTLAIQPTSYRVIHNREFGNVMEALLGLEDDEHIEFEALFSLYEGRQVIALCYFPEPLKMPWDPSKNFLYLAFSSRHDGQGGLRGLPTNVRVQCANTQNLAESIDGRFGFTIRHTSNWKERLAELRQDLIVARGESQQWVEFARQLAAWKVTKRQQSTYLKRMFPVSDDMGERKAQNQRINRERVQAILKSDSCVDIAGTGYGLLMATTEWSDHVRGTTSDDSYVSRQLLRIEEPKRRSSQILRSMSGIKL